MPCATLQVLESNVIGGKYQRGLLVLIAFRALVEPRKQDAASVHRALVVGWCVEMVRAMPKGWGGEAHRSGVPCTGPGGQIRGPPLPAGTCFTCRLAVGQGLGTGHRGVSSPLSKVTVLPED